jgi:hypothetical protein
MVKQRRAAKTSSDSQDRNVRGYKIRAVVTCNWQMPEAVDLTKQMDFSGCMDSYWLSGTLTSVKVNPLKWRDSPHRAFANLPHFIGQSLNTAPLIDPKAMIHFVKRYGFLGGVVDKGRCTEGIQRLIVPTQEVVSDTVYGAERLQSLGDAHSQSLLQFAWETGSKEAIDEIRSQASKGFALEQLPAGGVVQIAATNLWTLICLLFLHDNAAGKTARCANPDCPAPFFLKSRRTQKICEAGDCVVWAQRRYALKWWHENQAKGATKKVREGKAK